MESVTKNRQPLAVLRAMVARGYGAAQVAPGDAWAEELGHGWFNVAYRIRLRDGRQVVLKVAPPAGVEVMTYEQDMMRTEVRALAIVRGSTAVPVPTVHLYDDTRELCDAEYFFMDHVDGENLSTIKARLSAQEYGAYAAAVGAANQALNQIPGDHFGSLLGAVPGEVTWRQVFTRIVEDVLGDGQRRGVDIGWDYDLIRRMLAEHGDCLDEVGEPAFIEWDLWAGNVMVRDGAIVGVIDHERALYGDPIMEAGFAATEMHGLSDPASFMRGYGKLSLTGGERSRRRLYNLHLVLVMAIETVYRGHTDPTQYRWARDRLGELMTTFGGRA